MTRHRQRTQPPHGVPDAHDEHRLGSSKLAVVLRVLGRRRRLRQRGRWTPQQLQAYQAQALRQLRDHAYAHTPFYRRFHAGHTDRPLQELPVLTKAMVMEHFDQLVTDPTVRLAEVEPTWPPCRATSGSAAAPGWSPPRARPAVAGSSCGTWTSE